MTKKRTSCFCNQVIQKIRMVRKWAYQIVAPDIFPLSLQNSGELNRYANDTRDEYTHENYGEWS